MGGPEDIPARAGAVAALGAAVKAVAEDEQHRDTWPAMFSTIRGADRAGFSMAADGMTLTWRHDGRVVELSMRRVEEATGAAVAPLPARTMTEKARRRAAITEG